MLELGDAVRPGVAIERLKPIAKVTGHGPSPDLVELAGWAAHRWAGPLRAVLSSASPAVAVRALPGPERPAGRSSEPADSSAAEAYRGVLGPDGGLVRCPPAASVVPIIEAAAQLGPVLIVTSSVERARLAGARLRGSGRRVALLPGEWSAAAAGAAIVVGARAAAWATVAGLAAIVVLDEHDEALQEERSPTWHARDVCIERAARAGIPCVLVSPTPSLAALEWAEGASSPRRAPTSATAGRRYG